MVAERRVGAAAARGCREHAASGVPYLTASLVSAGRRRQRGDGAADGAELGVLQTTAQCAVPGRGRGMRHEGVTLSSQANGPAQEVAKGKAGNEAE